MNLIKKHGIKRWELSIMEIVVDNEKHYKVTRRLPEMLVAETKIFKDKEEAKRIFDEWLK